MRYVLRAIDRVTEGYAAVVRRLVRVAVVSLAILVAVVVASGYLFKITPTGFLPEEDQGAIFAMCSCRRAPRRTAPAAIMEQVEEIMRAGAQRRGPADGRRARLHQRRRRVQQGVLRGAAQALRGAHRAAARAADGIIEPAARPAREPAGRDRPAAQPAADHRPGQYRRLPVCARGAAGSAAEPRSQRPCAV